MSSYKIIDELYENIIKYSIDSLCPITKEALSISVGHKLQFIDIKIIAKIDKDFKNLALNIIRKATQRLVEDHSLDGVGLSCEVV
jgi:hypothetical protein